jgi:hypothetical protein
MNLRCMVGLLVTHCDTEYSNVNDQCKNQAVWVRILFICIHVNPNHNTSSRAVEGASPDRPAQAVDQIVQPDGAAVI